jgi:two-component system chemotaxis sensor kinase CheA
VSVEKVDQLINLVGELVITQAMLTQQAKQFDPVQYQNLMSGISDLERNTRHLQESVMSIRMIPMSFVFNRFPRMIRDLAAKLGKDLELKMVGEATELDKGLIEKIIDPLTHLVRNSADHGIEAPTQRVAAGKPAQGCIRLSAAHQGGSILIEVADDGAGLSRRRILDKARSRGLPARDDMTDNDVWALIWEPGFSTAETLSDVSGRGVGMDVVKRSVTILRGTVEVDSTPGIGTTIRIRLPLTLAIIDGFLVAVGGAVFVVPLNLVEECVEITSADRLDTEGRDFINLRGQALPFVELHQLFDVGGVRSSRENVLVVRSAGRRIGLVVDNLIGEAQTVIKPLGAWFREVKGIGGSTILSDGRVALILDVPGLLDHVHRQQTRRDALKTAA